MARVRGFTLLEMVVVLALLALATAMAAPSSYRMIRAWRDAAAVDDALRQIALLPATVRNHGAMLQVPVDDSKPLARIVNLPAGWALRLDAPLLVRANGACNDSAATLDTGHQRIRFKIEAPFCRVRKLAADAP